MGLTQEIKDSIESALEYNEVNEAESYAYTPRDWEKIRAAQAWIEAQEVDQCPRDEIMQACPYCEEFTTVWKFAQGLTEVNARKCIYCGKWFIYFHLHPTLGTQQMTREEYRDYLREGLDTESEYQAAMKILATTGEERRGYVA